MDGEEAVVPLGCGGVRHKSCRRQEQGTVALLEGGRGVQCLRGQEIRPGM